MLEIKNLLMSNVARKMVSSLQPWATPTPQFKSDTLAFLFVRTFNHAEEQLFWQECHSKTLGCLKLALLLSSFEFLVFIIHDSLNETLTSEGIFSRLTIALILSALFLRLHFHPKPCSQIAKTAQLGAGFSILNLAGTILTTRHQAFSPEIWASLLPVYFFIYGQLFITLTESMIFGCLSILVLPASAYLLGLELTVMAPAFIIMLIVNLFGFFTRYQMENYSRMAFLARNKAEAAVAEKNLFFQQIGHNLRQPLQALSCWASVLESSCSEGTDSEIQIIANKLGYVTDELNKSFDQILHIANLENGIQQPHLKAVDINVLLSNLEDRFAPQAAKRDLNLKIVLRTKPPFSVYSDPCILTQIISNLIDNALKYTNQGWIIVKAVKIGGNRLKLHVCDSGIGIIDQQKQEIFKNFYRGCRRSDDRRVHGLGIGLAFVKTALENLPDHSLDYSSKAGMGSDFKLLLPISDQPIQIRISEKLDPRIVGSFVFIVDDDMDVVEALSQQLSCLGCLVQSAASKAETQKMLAENLRQPDLLITDFYLENQETAHDIIGVFQAEYGQMPTLILSARAIHDHDKEIFPQDTWLLRKPASTDQLLEILQKQIKGV